jgi:hypothetical protein
MRIVHCVRLIPALALALFSTAALAEITITIDKSAQRMRVERDGALVHTWPVSTGKAGYRTPSGSYTAFRMEKDHFSREWDDAPMPNSIFFTKQGHAIHGYLDTRNIGRPASHGCVRLEPQNAEKLFAMVKEEGVLNTKVVLYGREPAASGVPMARRTTPQDEEALRAEREQAERHYRERGYAAPRADGPDRYAYENYRQPYYAQPRYEQRYYVQAYRPRTYYYEAPPGYYYYPPYGR